MNTNGKVSAAEMCIQRRKISLLRKYLTRGFRHTYSGTYTENEELKSLACVGNHTSTVWKTDSNGRAIEHI